MQRLSYRTGLAGGDIWFKGGIGFRRSSPITFSFLWIPTVFFIHQCYEKVFQETLMVMKVKMHKLVFLHTRFISNKFSVVTFLIISPIPKTISSFSNTLLPTMVAC